MNFKQLQSILNLPNFINLYKFIKRFLLLKYYNKKKIILRNSFQTELLLKSISKKPIDFEKIHSIFFDKQIFAYEDKTKKEEIIKYLKQNCYPEVKKYIENADKIIKKEFWIFEKHYIFKNNINWHYSFFNDINWKLEKSEKIDINPDTQEIDVQ